jgi:hypothetical protein
MMVMTLIYVVYYDDRHIPRFIALLRHRHFIQNHSDVTFARLHVTNRSIGGDDGDGDDASVIDDGEVNLHFNNQQQLNQSFNNPMFDENIIVTHQQNANNNEDEKVNNEVVEEKKKA